MSKSDYYYNFTRNMSEEQIKNSPCGKPCCYNKEECQVKDGSWCDCYTQDDTGAENCTYEDCCINRTDD